FVEKAIEVEVQRQEEAWEDGVYDQEIVQETRLFDQVKSETRSMRGKEGAADYRYFPEPDLLKVVIDEEMMAEGIKIPEMPDEKRARFVNDYAMSEYNAGVLTSSFELAQYFEAMMEHGITAKNAVTWLTVELLARLKNGVTIETSPVHADKLAQLVQRIEDGTISNKAAKEVLDAIMDSDEDIDAVIDRLGLKQVSDTGALEVMIDEILAANEDKVAEYKAGKEKLLGFFVGQTMKASKGSANPQVVNELVKQKLS
ncbi:MAG TPA: Asp-tRNA(Asn)/Glu-tRNA(Gln) amidotransferase GatCAB subunit B, partial [Helicobacteraceae bacterium]|nr:Asp-tRNA(Asn)/Glu-tRNA(Gln) amidotransferase GatCAB subunit B [Helicobacteraceae bacterium]